MIHKLASYHVRKDAVAQALEATRAFVDEVGRKEGGTASYHAFQRKDEPARILHLMSFRTPSAEKYHGTTPWAKKFHDALAPLLAEPTVVSELSPVAAE